MTNPLKLTDVTIRLKGAGKPLVTNLSLTVQPGQVVTVMGPSGAGKSTLLAFVGGHLPPVFQASGRVEAGGRDVTGLAPQQRRIGILFQDDLLFAHLCVGDNLAFGLSADVKGRRARRAVVEAALVDAGLCGYHDRDPATLSGGQRARVALLRSLLAEPQALLLDEPFSGLDDALRADFRAFVFEHAAARRLPVLLVTHDRGDAVASGGTIITMCQQ